MMMSTKLMTKMFSIGSTLAAMLSAGLLARCGKGTRVGDREGFRQDHHNSGI